MTRLKNPFFIACGLFVARSILDRRFFRNVVLSDFYRRFHIEENIDKATHKILTSRRYRIGLILIVFSLLTGILLSLTLNSLQPSGLLGMYYAEPREESEPILVTHDQVLNLWRMKVDFPEIKRMYAIHWKGFIYAQKSGEYRFFTTSDDSSRLFIGDQVVVENGDIHGLKEESGRIALKKGLHPIEVQYVQWEQSADLFVEWQAPGRVRRNISHARLYPEPPSPAMLALETGLSSSGLSPSSFWPSSYLPLSRAIVATGRRPEPI
jgi:hypothetical protein